MTATGSSGVPWLTVITVVKDDLPGMELSVSSLMEQDCDGIEWVVVDSSSNSEDTQAVIHAAGGVAATYRWTPPKGIYPAMNAGLTLATGGYVHFLNAGDVYARHDVLSHLRRVLEAERPVWAYGQVAFVSKSGREIVPHPFDYQAEKSACFSRGRFPPHQGTVVSTPALRALGGFDQSYLIVADYAAALRLSLVADPVELPTVIARFGEGGTSTTRWRESLREFHRARVEILRPSGVAAARERLATVWLFAKMAAARMLGRQGRGDM